MLGGSGHHQGGRAPQGRSVVGARRRVPMRQVRVGLVGVRGRGGVEDGGGLRGGERGLGGGVRRGDHHGGGAG